MIQLMTAIILASVSSQAASEPTVGLCGKPWKSVYVHDVYGWDLQGSLKTLHKQIEGPYLVKVQLSVDGNVMTLPLDEFHIRGPFICGTSSWIMSDNGTHFGPDPEWHPIAVCTSGEIHQANYSTTKWSRDVTSQPLFVDGEVKWFTKPTSCSDQAVYTHFSDGSSRRGSVSELLPFAKNAALKINMRDRGYSIMVQNTHIFQDQLVTAQSLNHLSLVPYNNGLKYNVAPYYEWHAVWTSDGIRDISRWRLNSTTSNGHVNDLVALDWFGDECWRKVMATDRDGRVTHGSLEELIQLIRLGHEVRVHVDGFTLKATSLHLLDGMVIALTTDEFARRMGYPSFDAPFFNTNARIVYRLIHSSGKMRTFKFMIENYNPSEILQNQVAVDWLVDTRPWVKIHDTTTSDPTPESSPSLELPVSNGASVRIALAMDSIPGQLFLQTESVKRNAATREITVQSIKNVVTGKEPGGDDLMIPIKVSQLSFLINVNGSISVHERRLSTRVTQTEHLYSNINCTWFINL